jgi:hypothetical protein
MHREKSLRPQSSIFSGSPCQLTQLPCDLQSSMKDVYTCMPRMCTRANRAAAAAAAAGWGARARQEWTGRCDQNANAGHSMARQADKDSVGKRGRTCAAPRQRHAATHAGQRHGRSNEQATRIHQGIYALGARRSPPVQCTPASCAALFVH